MLYIKVKLNDQVEMKVDLYEDEVFSTCPVCGKEFQVESEDVKQIEDWASTSISCGKIECNEGMNEMCDQLNLTGNYQQTKKNLDGMYKFSIMKFIHKNKEISYLVFGYSNMGDEVEFGIRNSLIEAEELVMTLSDKEPDFHIIKENA